MATMTTHSLMTSISPSHNSYHHHTILTSCCCSSACGVSHSSIGYFRGWHLHHCRVVQTGDNDDASSHKSSSLSINTIFTYHSLHIPLPSNTILTYPLTYSRTIIQLLNLSINQSNNHPSTTGTRGGFVWRSTRGILPRHSWSHQTTGVRFGIIKFCAESTTTSTWS